MAKFAEYVKNYGNWQIYRLKEAYVTRPALQVLPLYVAINPLRHTIITGLDLPDLIADIDEAKH